MTSTVLCAGLCVLLLAATACRAGGIDVTLAGRHTVYWEPHFAWTDLNHRFAASVFAYSAAFLDHHVKGDPASADLTGLRGDVSRLLYDSELGRRDTASR